MRPCVRKKGIALLLCFLASSIAGIAWSQSISDSEAGGEKETIGLNVDLEISSIYNWRGINVFQEDSQHNQTGLLAPSITWSILDTGFSIYYWSAYQIRGENISELVDAGVGGEQDLVFGYDREIIEDTLGLTSSLTYFFYPFADRETAGVSNPSYIEPLVGIAYSRALDFGLNVSYYYGIQDELREERYIYINPSFSKTVPVNPNTGIDMAFGLGYKLWNSRPETDDNTYDLVFHSRVPVNLRNGFYLMPGIHIAWTNLEGLTAGREFMVYGSLNVGMDL